MNANPDVTILGTIVFDIFIPDVKKYPRKGEAVEIKSFPVFTGGCGSNTAIVLSKLGVRVSLIGAVGEDLFGKYVIDYLNECKVNLEMVKVSKSETTSTSILLINQKKRKKLFSFSRGKQSY